MTATQRDTRSERPFDASDPEQVGERQSKAMKRDLMRREGLKRVMAQAEGRAFMQELLEHCQVFGEVFSTHSNTMSFNVGKANVGRKLMADIFAAGLDEQYLLMGKEAR